MADRITVSGVVEASPRTVITDSGLVIASFRVRPRVDARSRISIPPGSVPGCYLVTAVDDLARGVAVEVRPGDRVVVGGTLVLRAIGDTEDVVAELHAEAIGLDIRPGRHRLVERPGSHAALS